ncbi:MAG: MFS transporter [Terracidiphilus sp.]|jgi:MFS family permease
MASKDAEPADAVKLRQNADVTSPGDSSLFSPSEDAQDRAVAKARRRLIPFLLLMYVISFLDRANIGFAKQAMQASVGISEHAFAMAAGLFFITYAVFELPSNLILHRVGARIWMARIMVTWGVASMATMFVTGSASFYLLRLLLGAAEAGFFPGVILYLTYWFPRKVRGEIVGLIYFGAPLAFILGGPISGLLLQMHPHFGLWNWQWMFLMEGFAAVAVGFWSYWFLDSRPTDARWLSAEEKQALAGLLAREQEEQRAHSPAQIISLFADLRIAEFVLIYALIQVSVYGAVFYLPSEVSAILHRPTGIAVGVVSAIPWLCALVAAFCVPWLADKLRKHRQLASATLFISGCASLALPMVPPYLGLAALSIAISGLIAAQPIFWTLPTNYLAGRTAAGGLAIINALGSVGGFVAPNVKVWADQFFGSQRAGTFLLAAITILNAGLIAITGDSNYRASPKRNRGENK